MLLAQFQSFSGTGELEYINLNSGDQIVAQMRQGKHPIRIDMPMGRKTNPEPYHTFIGKDAADALHEYFEKDRGWPGKGEPIWISKPLGEFQQEQLRDAPLLADGRVPLLRDGYRDNIRQLSRRIGLIPKEAAHTRGVRYGYNPNEIRDVARSVSRKAAPNGFDIICAEFWMGHTIDPLGYDKLQKLEPEWSAEQYRLVEPYLNIISNPPTAAISPDEAAKKAALATLKLIYRDRLPKEKWIQIERIFPQTVSADQLAEQLKRMIDAETDKKLRRKGSRLRRPSALNRKMRRATRTARNGGMWFANPYETRIVEEEELLALLNEGERDVVKEFSGGRIIVRRRNG
jgi:hypothetical protein